MPLIGTGSMSRSASFCVTRSLSHFPEAVRFYWQRSFERGSPASEAGSARQGLARHRSRRRQPDARHFVAAAVLGSTSDGRDYIQTVSKRGYRFVSHVREMADDELEGTRWVSRCRCRGFATAAADFVGREAELAEMQDLWQRAKSGQHQLLLIAGEPGIGKTRLAGVRAQSRRRRDYRPRRVQR